jgi:WD40 repeat protein
MFGDVVFVGIDITMSLTHLYNILKTKIIHEEKYILQLQRVPTTLAHEKKVGKVVDVLYLKEGTVLTAGGETIKKFNTKTLEYMSLYKLNCWELLKITDTLIVGVDYKGYFLDLQNQSYNVLDFGDSFITSDYGHRVVIQLDKNHIAVALVGKTPNTTGYIAVYNLDGNQVRQYNANADANCLTLGKKFIAQGCRKTGEIILFDKHSGNVQERIQGHKGHVNSLCELNGYLFSAGEDHNLIMWEYETQWNKIREFKHYDWVRVVKPLSYNLVVSTSDDNTVRIWNVFSGVQEGVYQHKDWVFGVDLIDHQTLVTAADDSMIKVWQ